MHVCMEACHECRHSVHLMSHIAIKHDCNIQSAPCAQLKAILIVRCSFQFPFASFLSDELGVSTTAFFAVTAMADGTGLLNPATGPLTDRYVVDRGSPARGMLSRVRLLYMRTCL